MCCWSRRDGGGRKLNDAIATAGDGSVRIWQILEGGNADLRY
jgi:hypothetical protein